jgi:hypothetical protein
LITLKKCVIDDLGIKPETKAIGMYTVIVGTLLLILDIYITYLIVTASGDPAIKLVWVIVVLLLPLLEHERWHRRQISHRKRIHRR